MNLLCVYVCVYVMHIDWLIDVDLSRVDWFESRLEENIWKYSTYEKSENVNENEWKREDKVEITEGWNTTRYRHTYDPLGEVFFFAASPFFKPPVFLAPAFAFGRGLPASPSCAE